MHKHNRFPASASVSDMPNGGSALPTDRARVGWWAFVLILALAAAFLAYSFVEVLVLGVFGYYATRPIYRRLARRIDTDGIAAGITVLVVVVPILLVVGYAGLQLSQQVGQVVGGGATLGFLDLSSLPPAQRETLTALVENPGQFVDQPRQTLQTVLGVGGQVLGTVLGTLVMLALAIALSYFLLRSDDAIAGGFRELVGGRDTTAHAYAAAVDADLESVFFGNLLFVAVMSAVAALAYSATNLLAPQGLGVPMAFVLAFLTGVASLIPLVVGKVVYLPVVAYLGFQAVQAGRGLPFVGGVLVVYFLVLDILPQTFIQPYITGRQLDMLVLMFAYILGPTLFGWYGFFFLPIVFVVMLEALRVPIPELVRGEALTQSVSLGEGVGTDPQSARDAEATDDEDTTAD
jgi:predicted PurR-regulated permease PerM